MSIITKTLAWTALLLAGVLSLPLAAAVLDDQGTENWILPVDLVAMALLGALVGNAVPGFVRGNTRRRVALGAACGVAAAVVGIVVFFLLLNGFDGA